MGLSAVGPAGRAGRARLTSRPPRGAASHSRGPEHGAPTSSPTKSVRFCCFFSHALCLSSSPSPCHFTQVSRGQKQEAPMCLLSTGRPGQALLSFYERSYKNLHAGVWGSEPGSRAQGYGYPPPAVHPGQVPGPRNAKRCLAGGVRNHTLQVPPEQRPTCRSHGLLRGSKSGTRQALRGIPGIQERRDLMGNWAVWTRRVILDGRAGRCRPAWPVLAHAQDQTLVPQEAPVAEPSRTTENRAHPGAPPPRDQVCSERRPLGPSGWAGRPLPAPSDRDALLLPTASLAPPPAPGRWAQTCSDSGGCATRSEPAHGKCCWGK